MTHNLQEAFVATTDQDRFRRHPLDQADAFTAHGAARR
jgi:hypothetical protein